MSRAVGALVHAWLILDFFGESRRGREAGSTLTTTIFGQAFLGLVVAALTWPERRSGTALVAFATANLSLSTLLVAIGAIGDPMRPDRTLADSALLGTAPVSRTSAVLSRALHRGTTLVAVTVGIALPPAILAYWTAGRQLAVVPGYLVLACAVAALAAGALSVALGALVAWRGPARGLVLGGTLKALLLAGGFVGFALCLRHLDGSAADLPLGRAGALAWPPYWAARLLADPLGALPFAATLAGAAAMVAAGAVALERAPRRRAVRATTTGILDRFDRWIAPRGPLRGAVAFTSALLYRSPGFRSKALPIFGLPAAMVGLSLWQADPAQRRMLFGVALQLPAIYLPVLVAFLSKADRPGSGWVFATSPLRGEVMLARRAGLISLSTHVLLPVQLVAALAMLALGEGPVVALALPGFALGAGVVAAAFALRRLEVMAFTDEEEGVALDLGSLLGAALVLTLAGVGVARIAGGPGGLALGAAGLVAAWLLLRRSRGV